MHTIQRNISMKGIRIKGLIAFKGHLCRTLCLGLSGAGFSLLFQSFSEYFHQIFFRWIRGFTAVLLEREEKSYTPSFYRKRPLPIFTLVVARGSSYTIWNGHLPPTPGGSSQRRQKCRTWVHAPPRCRPDLWLGVSRRWNAHALRSESVRCEFGLGRDTRLANLGAAMLTGLVVAMPFVTNRFRRDGRVRSFRGWARSVKLQKAFLIRAQRLLIVLC